MTESNGPRRVAVFAHYDAQGEIKPYIVEYLRQLAPFCERIVFVSTSVSSPAELEKVRPFCDATLHHENVGYDFCMWQAALRDLELRDFDELVLANSSVFGPVLPLGPIFERISAEPGDFWGMTENFTIGWHLQSYFLVFKRRVLGSPALGRFFASVLPYRDKNQVIRSYEIGLSTFLTEQGFQGRALVPIGSWLPTPALRQRLQQARLDATLVHPLELLQQGMPFVKALLFRENPGRVPLEPVREQMRSLGYDLELLRFDRPVKPRAPRLAHDLRRRLRGF